jgi:hypothetical protein
MAQLPQEVIDAAQAARLEVRKLARQTKAANRALAEYDVVIARMLNSNGKEHGPNGRSPNNRDD